ncbi:Dual specificity protein kinase pom1 [Teratosphaeria destructans]|uniref:Dual specificity protein kinase pom1 n=1 Tax=Teratosphaeria destructans TaxID=418781 RepID=A0A9W7SPX0_9PEZI|nr:Dual specificity protein kinase pom1 [Teratosphaeria destructans]
MDVATRYQPRVRAPSYLERERNAVSEDDAGVDSERRKFQRTQATESDASNTFRKPSIPASATRQQAGGEQRQNNGHRRKSTLRENVRVPSGPREFPSGGSRRNISISTINPQAAPAVTDTTNTSRSFLPESASEPLFTNAHAFNSNSFRTNQQQQQLQQQQQPRLHFGQNQHSSTDETDSPSTPGDFAPTMNFDDFQNSISDPNWTSPTLESFPTHVNGRALPKDDNTSSVMAAGNGYTATSTLSRPGVLRQHDDSHEKGGSDRTTSFKRRLSTFAGSRSASGQPNAGTGQQQAGSGQPNLSYRARRQSGIPNAGTSQPTGPPQPPVAPSPRHPRKSVGPGFFTSAGNERKGSVTQTTPVASDAGAKPGVARMNSVSKARRTTMQPPASSGPDAPRVSTLTATTQSRANKTKSLLPPTKPDPDTPGSGRKSGQNRAHTPSSSGNKRQSTVSGRASGLGARTISPTDARRMKRQSIMQAPPLPSMNATKDYATTPTPPDEAQNAYSKPELPRMAQPSPSLIPRKMSTTGSTPTSERASPESKQFSFPFAAGAPGAASHVNSYAPSLSAKSSYQSLASLNANPSTSRLPTPKARQNDSSRAEQYERNDDGEFVPPVPAIPKVYESPREQVEGFDFHSSILPKPPSLTSNNHTPRGSLDVSRPQLPSENPGKKASDFARPTHKRTNTIGSNANSSIAMAGAKSASRAQPDSNGRRNNNLQPLRLPPLNLPPFDAPTANRLNHDFPRPTQEVESRHEYASMRTPEPRRVAKTPTTPMTASKATFFARRKHQDDYDSKAKNVIRSSSSHYTLRDLHVDTDANGNMTRFFDDSDVELSNASGVPVPNGGGKYGRSQAITPFASGSLPKTSGEYTKVKGRPSGEYGEDQSVDFVQYANQVAESLGLNGAGKPQGPRPRTTGSTSKSIGTPSSIESPVIEQAAQLPEPQKKESGGLRRKLSLGWRRSSSKNANHPENKNSPQTPRHEDSFENVERMDEFEKKKKNAKLQKRQSEMPPPKLPASATWTSGLTLGDIPHLPNGGRPTSFENSGSNTNVSRRKSTAPSYTSVNASTTSIPSEYSTHPQNQQTSTTAAQSNKTKIVHAEQPQPVDAQRAISLANFGSGSTQSARPAGAPRISAVPTRHKLTASTISAIIKDKDDLAADEEMKRLSQKRKDVDSAARESEALKARALKRPAMSPDFVLHDSNRVGGTALNIFERGEVMDYGKDGVYFTGTKNAKKIIGTLSPDSKSKEPPSGNFGYDDERGDYNIVLGDHLAYRYEVVDVLGKGSFGQVVRCVDHKEGGVVAVKIIRNKKRFHQQALVEVGILSKLGGWDPDGSYATLSITSSFYFRSHLCIVTPCLSINLYEFIRAHNFVGFSLPLIRRFARQLLACLVLLQQKRIIHCDLKPENILLCEARKADVRVIDFGSSCKEEEKVYTYIQSRFYRSPEVILGSSYGLGIDMWSLGCILAELWTGYPIFPGENEQEQLACIMEIFGPPDRHLVERCTRKKLFFDSVGKPRVTVSSKGRRRRPSSKTLQQALKTDDDAFTDFVARCLRWDPDRRMKPAEAISHPFITNMPLNQRAGIPDEARRPSARVRSAAPGGPAAGSAAPSSSPVKRKDGNAFANAQSTAATPTNKPRALPETPQTAVRNGSIASIATNSQSSPQKRGLDPTRRHSILASAGSSATVAGSKRISNGAALSGSMPGTQQGQPQPQPQQKPSGNLAAMAANASMNTGAGGVQRWRGA